MFIEKLLWDLRTTREGLSSMLDNIELPIYLKYLAGCCLTVGDDEMLYTEYDCLLHTEIRRYFCQRIAEVIILNEKRG